jgi:hypothetical protein
MREEVERVLQMEEPSVLEVPYIPHASESLLEDFRNALQVSGRVLVKHRSPSSDPLVLKQRWLTTPSRTYYDEDAFYHAFDDGTFRQALRAVLTHTVLPPGLFPPLSDEQWAFLEEQEFLKKAPEWGMEQRSFLNATRYSYQHMHWEQGPAIQGIPDIGRTLEWYVAEWFRKDYKALACHGVETQELPIPGDLDVIALKDGMCMLVECKSSSQIAVQKLHNLLERSIAFHPDMTLLLIDTENAESVEHRTRQLCQLLDCPYEERNRQLCGKTVFRWIAAQNFYIANTGAGIAATLAAVLRFHGAMLRVRSYQ